MNKGFGKEKAVGLRAERKCRTNQNCGPGTAQQRPHVPFRWYRVLLQNPG